MKTLSRIILTAILFAITLVSCGKITPTGGDTPGGDIPGGNTEQEAGTRIITLSFDTKTTRTELIDSSTPVFRDKDEIMVAQNDGTVSAKICTVDVVNGVATLKTDLKGDLVAVYPADCAMFGAPQSDDEDAIWDRDNDKKITGVFAPSVQEGTFADANICMANIPADATEATFFNKTAVFVIDVPEGTTMLIVTSLEPIDSETGQRGSDDDYATISKEWDVDWYYSINKITIGDGKAPIPEHCFVSIMAEEDDAVLLRDLNFDVCLANGQGFMGGFSPKFLGNKYNDAVQAGAMYTGVEDHLHMYYSNPHSYEDGTFSFYWAAEDLVGPSGDFFMWGEIDGHSYDRNYWTNFKEDDTYGFATENLPTLSTTYEEGDVLRLEDDAAYQNWGGAWRMPIYSEIETLYGSGKTDLADSHSWCSYVEGVNPPTFDSSTGYYWTSEMGEDSQVKVFSYMLNNDTLDDPRIKSLPAYKGIHISPLSGIIEKYESD